MRRTSRAKWAGPILGAALVWGALPEAGARPIGGLWGATVSFSFNSYDLTDFNHEIFYQNARELFGSSLSALDPVRWGNGYGGALRYGVSKRFFIELGGERLEAKSVGGVFSLTQTVLVEQNASLWTGRVGLIYAYPFKWGTHINFGLVVAPALLAGKFEVQDSLAPTRFEHFSSQGVGVEYLVAEPEFFILSQSLRISFGYRQLSLGKVKVTEVDAQTAQDRQAAGLPAAPYVMTRSQSPWIPGTDPLKIDYSGVFARVALTVSIGKGR